MSITMFNIDEDVEEQYHAVALKYTSLNNSFNKLKDYVETFVEKNKEIIKIKHRFNAGQQYAEYVFSYFEACIATRNIMWNEQCVCMKYSYLFLLSHFFELVFKIGMARKNESFSGQNVKQFQNHNLTSLLEKNEKIFLKFLSKEHFILIVEELKRLNSYCNVEDISQSFRYPLQKDFKSDAIKSDLVDLKMDGLKRLVENHANILYIGLTLFFSIINENTLHLINIFEKLIEQINSTKNFRLP